MQARLAATRPGHSCNSCDLQRDTHAPWPDCKDIAGCGANLVAHQRNSDLAKHCRLGKRTASGCGTARYGRPEAWQASGQCSRMPTTGGAAVPNVRTWYAAPRCRFGGAASGCSGEFTVVCSGARCARMPNKIILPPIGDQLDAVGDLAAWPQGGLRPQDVCQVGVRPPVLQRGAGYYATYCEPACCTWQCFAPAVPHLH
jgi:hypothetical protein